MPRRNYTKAKIAKVAWRLFHEKGYDATTIDDIIEQSGTSKGSFYHYYSGKDALLATLPEIFDAKYEEAIGTLDPEMNIAAGAELLGNLIRRYYKVGDNMTERYKYALAAYNAGVGRIDDCLRVAQLLGTDTGYWQNVVNQVLPRMQDETTLATGAVKVGPFRGEETVFYVDNVIAIYERFCRICP